MTFLQAKKHTKRNTRFSLNELSGRGERLYEEGRKGELWRWENPGYPTLQLTRQQAGAECLKRFSLGETARIKRAALADAARAAAAPSGR